MEVVVPLRLWDSAQVEWNTIDALCGYLFQNSKYQSMASYMQGLAEIEVTYRLVSPRCWFPTALWSPPHPTQRWCTAFQCLQLTAVIRFIDVNSEPLWRTNFQGLVSSDTRYMDKVIEKIEQHAQLWRLLAAEGYDVMLLPDVLGSAGKLFKCLARRRLFCILVRA
jgi:hypothetical protein